MRNGPARWDLDTGFSLTHFLDGCAMLSKFEFRPKQNQVSACTRFLQSDAFKKMQQVRRPVYTEFGTKAHPDTTRSAWSRLLNRLVPSDLTDNDFANVYEVLGELYVTTESCNLWKLDPNDMRALLKVSAHALAQSRCASSLQPSASRLHRDCSRG